MRDNLTVTVDTVTGYQMRALAQQLSSKDQKINYCDLVRYALKEVFSVDSTTQKPNINAHISRAMLDREVCK